MILNLTQHPATPDQISAGVQDVPQNDIQELKRLLDFTSRPSAEEVWTRANQLAEWANNPSRRGNANEAMIGGAPFFMSPLETALRQKGLEPTYAFSVRESQEIQQADGSVKKTQVFKHQGFVNNNIRQPA